LDKVRQRDDLANAQIGFHAFSFDGSLHHVWNAGHDPGGEKFLQNRLQHLPLALDDIERIEVLKGSAASTLYGTEAAAGVIQIFTRRGSSGAPQWTFQLDQGFNRLPLRDGTTPDLAHDFDHPKELVLLVVGQTCRCHVYMYAVRCICALRPNYARLRRARRRTCAPPASPPPVPRGGARAPSSGGAWRRCSRARSRGMGSR